MKFTNNQDLFEKNFLPLVLKSLDSKQTSLHDWVTGMNHWAVSGIDFQEYEKLVVLLIGEMTKLLKECQLILEKESFDSKKLAECVGKMIEYESRLEKEYDVFLKIKREAEERAKEKEENDNS